MDGSTATPPTAAGDLHFGAADISPGACLSSGTYRNTGGGGVTTETSAVAYLITVADVTTETSAAAPIANGIKIEESGSIDMDFSYRKDRSNDWRSC